MKKVILAFAATMLFGMAFAQKGIIRGTVIDDANGEELIGVTVYLKGTSTGAVTDFEGTFQINAEPGTYDVLVSYVSFESVTVTGVEVEAGETTVLGNIRLRESVEELAEVIVTAEVIRDSETALLTVKKKSANVIDGISAESFKKIGDSNAASAVKRVPGVSIEGGKYVYVRGLGDRYTKSILNDVDIPGLDPDRNTLQMDIFPTNVIDNIIVLKSFTADLPADFTGGVVNIQTKDFPEEKIFNISGSLGFNPGMHFNSDYLSYEGGSTDWLGFDDGTRDIPTGGSTDIPLDRTQAIIDPQGAGVEFRNILESFNPTLGAMRSSSLMDFSLGMTLGNQFAKEKYTLGYNVAFTYKNETEFFDEVEYSRWGKGNTSDIIELDQREEQTGELGINNVLLGGLAGIALKTDYSKYKLNLLHLQNGESKAGLFEFIGSDQGANFEALQSNLEFSQRALTNILLEGTHMSQDATFEVQWKLSPTFSRIEDPDIRFTRFRTDNAGFTIGTESGLPERIWRNLEEINVVGKLDLSKDYSFQGRDAKVMFGGGQTYKQRDYEIQNFQILTNEVELTGDFNAVFDDENLYSNNNRNGVTYAAQFLPENPNKFDANVNNTSIYVSNEFEPIDRFKAIIGLRLENYVQRYSGLNQSNQTFDNVKVLDNTDLFPSANLIYKLTDNQNLRFSLSRTIARPSFKEASFATIIDPLTGRTFIGGFFPDIDVATGETIWDGNLESTRINNYDVRWEIFQKRGQTIAISGFYKRFESPIEIVQYVQAPNNFQPRNVGDGQVLGAELEVRQNLFFVSPALDKFSVTTNITVTDSRIEMSETEFNSRVRNARVGQEIDDTRDMAGQAPYIINAGLAYNDFEKDFQAGIYYNVQGETLQFVGIADRPDVYTVPFHSLNFNANKSFGPENRMKLSFKVENILNDVRESVFQSFGAEDQIFTSLSPGTAFNIGFGYKL